MCGGKRLSAFVSHLLPPADSGCRHGHAYLQPMREGVLRSGYPQQSVQRRCRKASKKAAKKSFDSKSRDEEYEQAYKREYMFWYNRIKKLEKNHASQEQIQRAKTALRQFRKEAGRHKKADSERRFIYDTIYKLDDWTGAYYSGNLRRVIKTTSELVVCTGPGRAKYGLSP